MSQTENTTCVACDFKCSGKKATSYVDMSIQHGKGICADRAGNNFDSWYGEQFTYSKCAAQCDAMPLCVGFDFAYASGKCRVRFSQGHLPSQNPGPFKHSWDQGIGAGPILGVKNGKDRTCYMKRHAADVFDCRTKGQWSQEQKDWCCAYTGHGCA